MSLDLPYQAAHGRLRGREPGELEVGLVEPHHLDGLDVRAHQVHDLGGSLAVIGEVGLEEHGLRAQAPGAGCRHRRGHPEPARLI